MSDEKKELFQDWPMKPILILPPDAMSDDDIAELRKNHLCVVVAKDPSKVKFVDPLPAASSRTQIEAAAIRLSRLLLTGNKHPHFPYDTQGSTYRSEISKLFVELLVDGTPLDPNGSMEEQHQKIFDLEKADEIRRLAREDAKAERAAAKAALTGTPPLTGTRKE